MSPIAGRIDRTALSDLRDTVKVGCLEIDRAPVTNARYRTFVLATGHRPPVHWPRGACPAALLEHPVVGIDFFDALSFARWAGGAIPTEEEWLMATGLHRPYAYVWGDVFEPTRCNTAKSGFGRTMPVGAHEAGTAPSGCVDLCGNVWELTCTAFPQDQDAVVVKGGSWRDPPSHARLDARFRTPVNKTSSTVGFRLVYGVPDTLPHFLDRRLVDRCLAHRYGNVPQMDEVPDRGAEFEETMRELRETAAKQIARLAEKNEPQRHATVEEALAIFDQLAAEVMPVPARWERTVTAHRVEAPAAAKPRRHSRLRAAAREIGRATCWRRILPVLKALLLPGRGATFGGRFAGAWAEIERPLPGPSLGRALGRACGALFIPSLMASLDALQGPAPSDSAIPDSHWLAGAAAQPQTLPRSAAPVANAWTAARPTAPPPRAPAGHQTAETPPARPDRRQRRETVAVSRGPAPAPGTPSRALELLAVHPRALFIAACISVGTVLVLLGTGDEERPGTATSGGKAADAALPEAAEAAAQAPAQEVSEAELEAAVRAIIEGTVADRVQAEDALISYGEAAYGPIDDALATSLPPDTRGSLRYVLAAIDEDLAEKPGAPLFVDAPPTRGIVLFLDSLDGEALESIRIVRLTGRAAGVPVTIVLSAGPNSGQTAERQPADFGRVDVYVDPQGAFARRMRIARLPSVAGLAQDGMVSFLLMGHTRRDRLADNVSKLLR